ncbi:MAG: hypothetical protein IJP61_01675 [Treponema sp.]|nr:hypothetical protein [Treponema sp.]
MQEGTNKPWSTDESILISGTSSSDGSGNWNVIKSVDTNAEATATPNTRIYSAKVRAVRKFNE